MMFRFVAIAMLALAAPPARAHRLDEYLQAAILSIEKDRLHVQMTLTPGVAVFPLVVASIDTDADSAISEAEQRAYVARVLKDVAVSIDGVRLAPQLVSLRFSPLDEMKQGRGGNSVRLRSRPACRWLQPQADV